MNGGFSEASESDGIKTRLIIAAINELEEHGLENLSLRRIATACDVSCAAPYKHFKNKDALILAMIDYINGKWNLLEKQIDELYSDNPLKKMTETAVANILFRIANPNFVTALLVGAKRSGLASVSRLDAALDEAVESLSACEVCESALKEKKYVLRSLVYGAALMITNGELENSGNTFGMIRERIIREFA